MGPTSTTTRRQNGELTGATSRSSFRAGRVKNSGAYAVVPARWHCKRRRPRSCQACRRQRVVCPEFKICPKSEADAPVWWTTVTDRCQSAGGHDHQPSTPGRSKRIGSVVRKPTFNARPSAERRKTKTPATGSSRKTVKQPVRTGERERRRSGSPGQMAAAACRRGPGQESVERRPVNNRGPERSPASADTPRLTEISWFSFDQQRRNCSSGRATSQFT